VDSAVVIVEAILQRHTAEKHLVQSQRIDDSGIDRKTLIERICVDDGRSRTRAYEIHRGIEIIVIIDVALRIISRMNAVVKV